MGEKLAALVKEIDIDNDLTAKYVRCDNGGENSWIKNNLLESNLIEK